MDKIKLALRPPPRKFAWRSVVLALTAMRCTAHACCMLRARSAIGRNSPVHHPTIAWIMQHAAAACETDGEGVSEKTDHDPAANAVAIDAMGEANPVGAVRDGRSLCEMFSTPFNWCDRRCERCLLADQCPLYLRDRQRRWVHEARGEDPDAMSVIMSDVEDELALELALGHPPLEGDIVCNRSPLRAGRSFVSATSSARKSSGSCSTEVRS